MEPVIVLRQIDVNDLQPLYFIPWIPGIEDSQHAQFRTIGLNELTARVYTQILAKVGRVRIPATLTLCAIELLNRATFGVFGKWRDTDRKQFSTAVVKITERVLAPVVQVRSVGSEHVEVDLPDDESLAECKLGRQYCASWDSESCSSDHAGLAPLMRLSQGIAMVAAVQAGVIWQ